jgi:hypothetical protein
VQVVQEEELVVVEAPQGQVVLVEVLLVPIG